MCAEKKHAYKNIERRVLSQYGATRLQSGEVQLKLRYRTDQDLNDLRDDLMRRVLLCGLSSMRACNLGYFESKHVLGDAIAAVGTTLQCPHRKGVPQ